MKKLLVFTSLFFVQIAFSQSPLRDTLNPFKILKNEPGKSTVVFDNTSAYFEASDPKVIETLKTAIKNKTSLVINYTALHVILNATSFEVSKKEKFLEKHDTLIFSKFKFDDNKSLKKNEKLFLKELALAEPALQQEIPEDSLAFIFNYISGQSCETISSCPTRTSCISFDYKVDGCYARAHWMKKILEENFGYDCEKVFVYGALQAINGGRCGAKCIYWGYHVAPYVKVKDKQGNVTKMVLDPSLFNSPVTLQQWIAAQEVSCCTGCNPGKHSDYEITPASQYTPGGSTDINYSNTKYILNKFCEKCH